METIKKINSNQLYIGLFLLILLTTSCQKAKLKTAIEIANKECPINMGEAGTITSITYNGDNVVYNFRLNEEIANIKALKSNPESIKESMKVMYQNPTKEVRTLLSLVIEGNAGLQMIFVGDKSGDTVTSMLTTAELKEILNTKAEASQSDQAKLEVQIKMANLQFPMQASKEVVIEKIELNDSSVTYICQVDEEICSIDQVEANAVNVKKGIVTNLRSQTDEATQTFIRCCVNCNRNITYRYVGNQSDSTYDVVVSVAELKTMLH